MVTTLTAASVAGAGAKVESFVAVLVDLYNGIIKSVCKKRHTFPPLTYIQWALRLPGLHSSDVRVP